MIQPFESVLLRRTFSKPVSAIKAKIRVSSDSLLHSPTINKSLLESTFFLEKLKPKPLKRNNTLQKFHQFRKRMASKANQRIKKITLSSAKAELNQTQKRDGVDEFDKTGLLCNKAIVYSDKQRQQESWKKGLATSSDKLKSRSSSRSKLFLRIKTEISDFQDRQGRNQIEGAQETKTKFNYLRKKIDSTFLSNMGQEYLFNSTSTAQSGLATSLSSSWRKSSEEVKGQGGRRVNLREKGVRRFGKNANEKVEPWMTYKSLMQSDQFGQL